MKKYAILPALILSSTGALAQDYQFEIGAEYESNDVIQATGIFGQVFFGTVNTDAKALREAAFLERKSNVYATYIQEDFELGDNEDAHLIGTELYLPKAYLYLGLQYISINDGDWGATLGVTPMDGLRITTQYWNDVDYDPNIQVKYVSMLSAEHAINIEFKYYESEGDDTIEAELDYYIDRTFSIGLNVIDFGDTDYTLQTEKFFYDQFSARASYTFSDFEDTWSVGAAYRF